jgi:hypothetical protein
LDKTENHAFISHPPPPARYVKGLATPPPQILTLKMATTMLAETLENLLTFYIAYS